MMKKTLKFIGIGLVILIMLALLLGPGITRRYVVKNSPELIGRAASIDHLRVYYLTGKLRITGFTLFEADRQRSFVSFDTLVVDLKPLKLLRRELNLQHMYLSGFSGMVIQQDSIFNFSDLLAYHTAEKPGEPEGKENTQKEDFKYHLYDIELQQAGFLYENRNINDTLLLRNISFTIPYVGWDQAEKSEAGLKLNLEHNGSLEAGININPSAGDFDMTLQLQQINLEGFTKLTASRANIGTLGGIFQTHLDLRGNISAPERTVVSGSLEIRDLLLTDIMEKQILGAHSIRMDLKELDPYRQRFLVDSLILEEPYIYLELLDSTLNVSELLEMPSSDTLSSPDGAAEKPSRPTGDQAEDPGSIQPVESGTESSADPGSDSLRLADGGDPSLYYALQSFRIDSGTVDFRDNTTGEPFDYHLSALTLQSDSITSQADWVSLYASMLLNERGKLVAEVGFDPLTPSNFTLDYTITDFQLNDLNIYSRHYVGFPIVYGEMFYRGHTEVKDKSLVSDNHLIMDHVELGEKRGGLMDLPLRLALYILKDRNDVIDLEIPVRGRTDDPEVSVGQIVWNTLKNLIVRTAAAPYDYLSGLLGVDPEDIESIAFGYRDTTLTDPVSKQLETLLELEEIKPSLEIELIYFNDPDLEKREILMEETESDSAAVQALDPAVLEAINPDSLVTTYETLRIRKVESYLRTNRDSTQITVIRSDPRDPMNVGSMPRFEVKYSMKDENLVNQGTAAD